MWKFSTKNSWFLMFALCFLSFSVTAQKTVTGVITDGSNGEPLIGANVLIKGTSSGTVTDADGSFSLTASQGDVLVISYTGYTATEVSITGESVYNVKLNEGKFLEEIVVTGYGSQKQKEITSAVASLGEKDFNKGPISDPTQLLQGKVAGLQVYNRGGDPNRNALLRLRGISTVGANVEPLIVIDGVIGASLSNVDPADIETMDVLKDGSASAIYGSRGSSGVIMVTTKKGKAGQKVQMSYSGQAAVATKYRTVPIMNAQEFVSAGGLNLNADVNYIDEVTSAAPSFVHNLSAQGGIGKSSFRISGNARNTNGILNNTGFDQYNARMNFSTKAFNDKVNFDFNTSFTNRNSQFGFNDALRYAVSNNPTAPIYGKDSPFPFNANQFGGYFELEGLFDAFNPVALIELNRNDGRRKEFNYGASAGWNITDNLTLNLRVAQQSNQSNNTQYYPTTSQYRGGATGAAVVKGRADFYNDNFDFKLLESYASYLTSFGSNNLTLTGGYSFQQDNFFSSFFNATGFPNDSKDFSNIVEVSKARLDAGRVNIGSDASPNNRIIAFFGRANFTIKDAIFLNASLRREGSSKLGSDNRWGLFPAVGVGVDLNKYLSIANVDIFKVRLGYGVTGALPGPSGLSQAARSISNGATGGTTSTLVRAANPNLKWEEKGELNLGVEFGTKRLNATVDVYNRDIKDFILTQTGLAAQLGVDAQVRNLGSLNTKGLEVSLNYDLIQGNKLSYTTGINLSTYKTVLNEFIVDAQTRANLGAPGQNGTNVVRVAKGEEIGQIWGPVFDGVGEAGVPKFKDINGDGKIVSAQDKALDPAADFQVLGKGIPSLELGWNNALTVGGFNINAFIRGAFGHSLVNSFRAFYEPRIPSQVSYNLINSSKAVEGLKAAQFSSLYVEKADFIKLDNLQISRAIKLPAKSAISGLTLSLTGQNLFVITGYTGADPEPALVDYGDAANGGNQANNPDVLAPGLDRRSNFFAPRTITFGLNFNF